MENPIRLNLTRLSSQVAATAQELGSLEHQARARSEEASVQEPDLFGANNLIEEPVFEEPPLVPEPPFEMFKPSEAESNKGPDPPQLETMLPRTEFPWLDPACDDVGNGVGEGNEAPKVPELVLTSIKLHRFPEPPPELDDTPTAYVKDGNPAEDSARQMDFESSNARVADEGGSANETDVDVVPEAPEYLSLPDEPAPSVRCFQPELPDMKPMSELLDHVPRFQTPSKPYLPTVPGPFDPDSVELEEVPRMKPALPPGPTPPQPEEDEGHEHGDGEGHDREGLPAQAEDALLHEELERPRSAAKSASSGDLDEKEEEGERAVEVDMEEFAVGPKESPSEAQTEAVEGDGAQKELEQEGRRQEEKAKAIACQFPGFVFDASGTMRWHGRLEQMKGCAKVLLGASCEEKATSEAFGCFVYQGHVHSWAAHERRKLNKMDEVENNRTEAVRKSYEATKGLQKWRNLPAGKKTKRMERAKRPTDLDFTLRPSRAEEAGIVDGNKAACTDRNCRAAVSFVEEWDEARGPTNAKEALKRAADCSDAIWWVSDGLADDSFNLLQMVRGWKKRVPIHVVGTSPDEDGKRFLRKVAAVTGGVFRCVNGSAASIASITSFTATDAKRELPHEESHASTPFDVPIRTRKPKSRPMSAASAATSSDKGRDTSGKRQRRFDSPTTNTRRPGSGSSAEQLSRPPSPAVAPKAAVHLHQSRSLGTAAVVESPERRKEKEWQEYEAALERWKEECARIQQEYDEAVRAVEERNRQRVLRAKEDHDNSVEAVEAERSSLLDRWRREKLEPAKKRHEEAREAVLARNEQEIWRSLKRYASRVARIKEDDRRFQQEEKMKWDAYWKERNAIQKANQEIYEEYHARSRKYLKKAHQLTAKKSDMSVSRSSGKDPHERQNAEGGRMSRDLLAKYAEEVQEYHKEAERISTENRTRLEEGEKALEEERLAQEGNQEEKRLQNERHKLFVKASREAARAAQSRLMRWHDEHERRVKQAREWQWKAALDEHAKRREEELSAHAARLERAKNDWSLACQVSPFRLLW